MDDWLGLHDFVYYRTREGASLLFEDTFLESSSNDVAFFVYTLLVCLTTFAGIMLSMFMILWIERKFYARVNDRRGATTALRSLWVGENGVTAGEWWNMVPYGLGKPIGAINGWLNKVAGNSGHSHEMVNRVGNRSWYGVTIFPGFFQNIADGMKFLTKEHMVPSRADKVIFELAPFLVITSTIMILGMIPLSSGIYGANPELSVLFAFAIFGIAPLGVFFAGWSSNNKYTLLGGIRSAAQLTAYEIPLLLSILGVCIMAGSFNFLEIVHFQHSSGTWLFFLMPLGGVLFLVSMIAEVERIPFDMPEAEAELVEGWWTEYGGMRFGLLFAAEYMRVYAASILFAHFFLGGWHAPFAGTIGSIPYLGDAWLAIPGIIWTLLKAWFIFTVVFVWARTALPRIRTDQILEFGWRMLLPLAVLQVALSLVYRLFFFDSATLSDTVAGGWSWDLTILDFTVPWGLPILTTLFWLGVFIVLMKDENIDENEERMYHIRTMTPAGTHTAGKE